MNARVLKILVASQNARRCLIVSLAALLLLTWCGNTTTTAQGLPANNWSPNQVQAPASGDDVIIPNSGAYTVTCECAMPPINDLLCHHRRQTRSRFDNNFQNDFTVTRIGHIPLNSSGIVIASSEVAQPVMFLNTATARGPPWSGDQSLYLSDNALDRPAPHFSTDPLPSEFHFHDSSSTRNATRLLIQSSMVSRAGTLLVAAISPIKYNPTVHLKELL
ncbi:MAG TPA: hypothetical protein VIK53_01595 [Verrucomicrobiae bacterium]